MHVQYSFVEQWQTHSRVSQVERETESKLKRRTPTAGWELDGHLSDIEQLRAEKREAGEMGSIHSYSVLAIRSITTVISVRSGKSEQRRGTRVEAWRRGDRLERERGGSEQRRCS